MDILYVDDTIIDDILELPELPEGKVGEHVMMERCDSNGRWWGIYRYEGKVYRGKSISEEVSKNL